MKTAISERKPGIRALAAVATYLGNLAVCDSERSFELLAVENQVLLVWWDLLFALDMKLENTTSV